MGIAQERLGNRIKTETVQEAPPEAAPSARPSGGGKGIANERFERGTVQRAQGDQGTVEHQMDTKAQVWDNRLGRSRLDRLRGEAAQSRAVEDVQRTNENLDHDFAALQAGDPEEVRDWRQLAAITVSLGETDDAQAQELKDALLWNYGDQLKDHVGAIDSEWWDSNYTEPPEAEDDSFLGWKSKLGKAAPVFEYLDQWGQSALGAIGGIESALDRNDGISAGDGLRHAARQGAAALDVTRAIPGFDGISQGLEGQGTPSSILTSDGREMSFDRNGDGSLNLREALGKTAEGGGRWLGAIDLIGTIALDPSTYATLGSSSLARVGMKGAEEVAERIALDGVEAVARGATKDLGEAMVREAAERSIKIDRVFVQELNQRIAKDGFKNGLDEVEQRWYTNLVRMANETATGPRTTRFGRDVADNQLDQIARGGQSGLRIGGSTIVPTRGIIGETLGRGSDNFGRETITETVEGGVSKFPNAQMSDEILDAGLSSQPRNLLSDARGALGNPDPLLANRAARRAAGTSPEAAAVARMTDDILQMANDIPMPSRLHKADDTVRELERVIRTGGSRGLAGQVLDIPQVRAVLEKLSPRMAIQAIHGSAVSQRLGHLLSVTRQSPKIKEIMVRLGSDMHKGGMMARSIEEVGSKDEWERLLNKALSSAEGMVEVRQLAGPELRQMIHTMDNVRGELREAAIKGGATEAHLQNVDSYLPRVLTDAARNNSDMLKDIQRVLGDNASGKSADAVAEGFMNARGVAQGISDLFEVNEEVARVLKHAGIDTPEQIFETNPVAAMAARAESAFRAASEVELLTGITKLDGVGGRQLGFRASPDAANKLSADEVAKGMIRENGGNFGDYSKVTLDNGDVFRIHKDVADELENVRRIFGDPKAVDGMGKFFDKMNNIWAMSATVMGLNPGFQVRNGIGNMFNAFLGGTRDPAVFARAASMQTDLRRITKGIRESGDDWDTVVKGLRGDIPDETLDILTGARATGVLNDGRSLDVLRDTPGKGSNNTGIDRTLRQKLNPTDSNSILNKPGVIAGETIENNARLGVYIDQINKGASPEIAAQHVKATLFDYGDLTRFENEKVRRASRFYTFMRKNTALQAYTLAHYPGRVANAEAGIQGIVDAAFGGESDTERSLPPWMPGASVFDVGGGQAAIAVDTPFKSFEEVVEILTGPPTDSPLDRLGADSYLKGLALRSTDLFSGFGPGVIDFVTEMETGRDSFTGRTLDPENQMRDRGWFGALATVFPAMSRFEGIAARNEAFNERFSVRLDKDGNPTGTAPGILQILNFASGLQTYELTEDNEGIGRYTLMKELEAVMAEMEDAGIEVPTIAELRESGEIQMRNRVLETLMYGWTEQEDGSLAWDNEAANAQLLQILPKNVRDAFVGMGVLTDEDLAASEAAGNAPDKGNRLAAEEGSDEYFAQQDFDFGQALTAIEEYLDRPLSDEEKWTMVSAFGGALGITDQENAGFNPYRENRLTQQFEDNEAADNARKEELFNRRLAAVGMTWDQALERNPRISTMQRRMDEAREAGWSEDEIRTALYFAKDEGGQGWTSRADRAAINQFMTGDRNGGAVPLTLLRTPITTDEDLQKLQTKVWDASEELRLIYAFEGWGTPGQQELFMYGVNSLTKTEQRMLGIDPLDSAPNREDTRSDEQKLFDARQKLGAVETGLAQGPYRWDPTQQPDFAPWEQD